MSHPDSSATGPDEAGAAGQPAADQPTETPPETAPETEPAPSPPTPVAPVASAAPTAVRPVQAEYLSALEPPDPTPPGVPAQPGADDRGAYQQVGRGAHTQQPAFRSGGGKVALVLVSLVALLAVLGGGVLAYLFWDATQELDEVRERLAVTEQELVEEQSAHEAAVTRLRTNLQGVEDDLAATQQELEGAQNMVELLRGEQGVIRRCVTLNAEVLDAIIGGDQAAFDAVIDEAEAVCDEADRILGS